MSEIKLYDGLKLSMIIMSLADPWDNYFVGENIERISVVMENGQIEKVPWANVYYKKGAVQKVNLARAIVVEIMENE